MNMSPIVGISLAQGKLSAEIDAQLAMAMKVAIEKASSKPSALPPLLSLPAAFKGGPLSPWFLAMLGTHKHAAGHGMPAPQRVEMPGTGRVGAARWQRQKGNWSQKKDI